MSQMFVIVLRPPAEAPDPWTADTIRECYFDGASEAHSREDIGIAEVVADDISGGWAEAMLEANAQIDNLG